MRPLSLKPLSLKTVGLLAALGAGSLPMAPAIAAGMLTAANGMTLYTFDADMGGKPSCYGGCATNWPPYLGKAGETMGKAWTLVPRTDGAEQWAYDGKPVYFFKGDKKKGDAAGNGMGGKWHVVAQ